MITSKTATLTKANVSSLISVHKNLNDTTGWGILTDLLRSMDRLGAVIVNVTFKYRDTFIQDSVVNWMELPNGTRLM